MMSRLPVLFCALFILHGCSLHTDLAPPVRSDSDISVPDGGAVDLPDVSGDACTPESDNQFCQRLNKDCGMVTGFDNCGNTVTIDCGSCAQGVSCGDRSPNVCGCPCDIDGTCFPDGSLNPSDPCQICDPSQDETGWSLNVGASCGGDDPCGAAGTCQSDGSCDVQPVDCTALDGECAVGVCDALTGECVAESVNDGMSCDGGLGCQTGTCEDGTCATEIDPGFCVIGDRCRSDGKIRGNNSCEVCDPSTSQTSWSALPDGSSCDDGLSCTSDVCMGGTCEGMILDTSCLIEGACHATGSANPDNPCEICDPGLSKTSWSAAPAGTNCLMAACATGTCQGTSCQVGATSGCYIDETCYASGTENPNEECEVCDPADSETSWSPRPDETECQNSPACSCQSGECRKANGMLCI